MVNAHPAGQPLHFHLVELGARFEGATRTSEAGARVWHDKRVFESEESGFTPSSLWKRHADQPFRE